MGLRSAVGAVLAVAALNAPVVGVPPQVAIAAPPTASFTADVMTAAAGSGPALLTTIGARMFFVADDGVHGEELYVTDGVAPPTLIDLNPGGGSSPRSFTDIGGVLWFAADDGVHGLELWTSDGTVNGTAMVADIAAGVADSVPSQFVEFDGLVHFVADDGVHGRELWRSDGATASLAVDVDPTGSSEPNELVAIDYPGAPAQPGRLWFSAAVGAGARDLVSVDTLGTLRVELVDREPTELVAVGEELFSRARTVPALGVPTLYRSARSGAVFSTSALGGSPTQLTAFQGHVYFVDGSSTGLGLELARWNGTAIEIVEDIVPGGGSSWPQWLTPAGATMYFTATTDATGFELWRTDGTSANTTMVADIAPGTMSSSPTSLRFRASDQLLVFSAQTATAGVEPWYNTGGPAAPAMVEDVTPGVTGGYPEPYAFLPAGIFFGGFEPTVGVELLRWAGPPSTPDPIQPFADIRPGTLHSFPTGGVAVGSRVMWTAQQGSLGFEPFVHDPATGTTSLLRDVHPLGSSDAYGAVSIGATALFFADAGDGLGSELWRTDGTTAGTTFVEDLNPGPPDAAGDDAFAWQGVAYFRAETPATGSELWRSDGTAAGTFRLADLAPGSADGAPYRFTPMGPYLYFIAASAAGDELWRTDGTTAGTVLVANGPSRPVGVTELVSVGSSLLFIAEDDTGFETVMWRSDGTAAGTAPLQDLAGTYASFPQTVTVSGSRAFFHAESSATGDPGIWVTDGSAAGTRDLLPSTSLFPQDDMAPTPTGVVFVTDDPATGIELWESDGTTAGTGLLRDFVPGAASGAPTSLTAMNGFVYLTASTTAHGRELWRTDGTVAGTERITDLFAGPKDGLELFAQLRVANDRLWFRGTDLEHGTEMWYVADVPPAPPAPGTPTAAAGPASATVSWAAVSAPAYAPITGYTVTAAPGGATCTTASTSCVVAGLTPGTSYTFTVTATNRIGSSPASAPSNAVVATAPPVVTVQPARLLETRTGEGFDTVDGLFQGIGRQPAGAMVALTVTGRGNVPAGAAAVMLNVTAVFPGGAGFLTVFPCGEDRPNASSVNYQPGQVVPNAVLAKVGANGQVCIFTTAAADLLVDVNGYVPAGGSPSTVSPGRLLDTRSGPGIETVDGLFLGVGRQPAGATLAVTVTGRGDVPAGATAVMLNVTAVVPDGPGFLTVFPCGADRPNASSVNYQGGQVVPNAVLAQVGTGGQVCIFTTSAADLLVDVSGYVPAGSAPTPVVPARLLETRSGVGFDTVDGAFDGIGRRVAGSVLELPVTGRGNVPSGAASVMVNVTAVVPDGPGFLTVFPCGQPQPLASSVNYQGGQVVPNAVLAKIGTGGRICIFTTSDADLLVDVTGWT